MPEPGVLQTMDRANRNASHAKQMITYPNSHPSPIVYFTSGEPAKKSGIPLCLQFKLWRLENFISSGQRNFLLLLLPVAQYVAHRSYEVHMTDSGGPHGACITSSSPCLGLHGLPALKVLQSTFVLVGWSGADLCWGREFSSPEWPHPTPADEQKRTAAPSLITRSFSD